MKRGDHVQHEGFDGIALWVTKAKPNKDGKVKVRMIGDDMDHLVDPDDLAPIDDEEFCSGCGQIGCTAYG